MWPGKGRSAWHELARRAQRLPRREQSVLVQAVVMLCVAWLMRRLVPRCAVHRCLSLAPRRGRVLRGPAPGRIIALTDAAAAHLPIAASCLDRAVAARWILGWRGIPATLVIGTAQGTPFAPHAWLDLSHSIQDTHDHRVLWHSA